MSLLGFMTSEDGTNRLSGNVDKKLSLFAAQKSITAQISPAVPLERYSYGCIN
jgi:hypothetical protein